MSFIKFVRFFLLVLIILGIGLIITQKIWVPKLVQFILMRENFNKESTLSEGVVCSSTIPTTCHKFKCNTGYLYPPPGGGSIQGKNLCSDGSDAVNLGEVQSTN